MYSDSKKIRIRLNPCTGEYFDVSVYAIQVKFGSVYAMQVDS